ncbi:hypothetical protein FA13DRAFT_1710852 [Coprinellus micaceus]|uniref:Uncharacterized protein n=1 Tax=Coprinellus micaceus TaxID=71717 RepID=A0A4Y7T5Y6_COPMI|nr:hypothetical protein FA13DRAFT_1710852 [Coprinellus micaceus]
MPPATQDCDTSLPPSSDDTPHDSSLSSDDSVMAARYYCLVQSMSKEKCKRDDSLDKVSLDKVSLTQLDRGIRKKVDCYTDIEDLIVLADKAEGRREHLTDPEDEEEDLDEEAKAQGAKDEAEEDRMFKSVRIFCADCPNFTQSINNQPPKQFRKTCTKLQQGANNARSNNVNKLKPAITHWVNALLTTSTSHLAVDPGDRSACGLQHNKCGELLSPIEHDWSDPGVWAKIQSCEEGYELSMFAWALYAGYSGDASKLEAGYLKSPLLLKTFKHIFTSPSSARGVDVLGTEEDNELPSSYWHTSQSGACKASRKNVAATLHMKSVTPRTIVYAAIRVVFAPSWCMSHQGMDFSAICYDIIDYFKVDNDNKETKAVQDLLRWWNKHVFPESLTSRSKKGATAAKSKLQEQCAARLALADLN